jgi:hypothetical protein
MFAEKKVLTFEEIETQSALELPQRMLPLITVVITNVLNGLSVSIPIQNNKVAVQVCATVQALNTILVGDHLNCAITQ